MTRAEPYFVKVLRDELARRKTRNSRYSLRAFARFLEIDPASLSRVLSGKQDLSVQSGIIILTKLALPAEKAAPFIAAIANDKRNRSMALLTAAIDLKYSRVTDVGNPRNERILTHGPWHLKSSDDIISVSNEFNSIMDLEGRFLDANETLARDLNTIPCNLIGKTWNDTGYPADLVRQLNQQQNEVVESGREQRFEFHFGEGSERRYLERTVMPIFGRDGDMRGWSSSIRDITWHRFQLDALHAIFASVDVDDVLAAVLKVCTPRLSEASLIFVVENGASQLKSAAHARAEKTSALNEVTQKHSGEILNQLGELGSAHFVDGAIGEDQKWAERFGLKSFTAVSMSDQISTDRVLMLYSARTKKELAKFERDSAARVIGTAAAQAIRNARKYGTR